MKLATFTKDGVTRLGAVEAEEVIDLSFVEDCPPSMLALLNYGADGIAIARAAASTSKRRFALNSVRLEPPIPNPRKFLGLGGSYRSHLDEVAHLGVKPAAFQTWFNKQVTCVNGPYDPIHAPKVSETLDYEGELAFVIGKRCRHLKPQDSRGVIAGFLICNDVSVREWQMRASTAMLGKSFDTHGPIGPWLVTPDELPNIHSAFIRTWVNGELRQDGNTSELIYRFGEMLVELSTVFTLEPGDILTTGTPAGVGGAMRPPRYLKPGDLCRVEIEGIGYIENRVIPEPEIAS